MDVHVPRPITRGLRRHGVEVLTAQEDGTARWEDADLLNRATLLDRVLFSQDEDLLIEAANRQRDRVPFNGLIYAPQLALSIRAVHRGPGDPRQSRRSERFRQSRTVPSAPMTNAAPVTSSIREDHHSPGGGGLTKNSSANSP